MAIGTAECGAWMRRAHELITQNEDLLTNLDRAIGDADHGLNMRRGFDAVVTLDPAEFPTLGEYFVKIGMTLVSTVGGASGPLYGTFFLRFGKALAALPSDANTGEEAEVFGGALHAGVKGIEQRGKAHAGEKTMLDTWLPALEAYDNAPLPLGEKIQAAARAGNEGADATIDMVATKGRASYLGERSVGTADPGATSSAFIVQALAEVMS